MDLSAKTAHAWGRTDYYVDLLPSLTGTRRKRIFGKTPVQAVERAKTWLQERRALGPLQDISTPHRALLMRYRDTLSIAEMESAFARAAGERITQKTVEDAMREYLAQVSWSSVTRQGSEPCHLKFSAKFAKRSVASLKPREMADFLSARGRSAPNYRRWLNAFFRWCREIAEYTDRNPLDKVPRVDVPRTQKQVFKPAQMARLLEAARGHHPSLALFVLGGLAGLRHAEAMRATWGDFRGKTLHIPRMKTQKRGMRERYIELNPAALSWLALIPRGKPKERIVGNNKANSCRNRERIRKSVKLPWPKNVLRRSYGSHHLAAYENADLTAKLMGHTSAEETYADYYCAIPKAKGVAWFAMRA